MHTRFYHLGIVHPELLIGCRRTSAEESTESAGANLGRPVLYVLITEFVVVVE